MKRIGALLFIVWCTTIPMLEPGRFGSWRVEGPSRPDIQTLAEFKGYSDTVTITLEALISNLKADVRNYLITLRLNPKASLNEAELKFSMNLIEKLPEDIRAQALNVRNRLIKEFKTAHTYVSIEPYPYIKKEYEAVLNNIVKYSSNKLNRLLFEYKLKRVTNPIAFAQQNAKTLIREALQGIYGRGGTLPARIVGGLNYYLGAPFFSQKEYRSYAFFKSGFFFRGKRESTTLGKFYGNYNRAIRNKYDSNLNYLTFLKLIEEQKLIDNYKIHLMPGGYYSVWEAVARLLLLSIFDPEVGVYLNKFKIRSLLEDPMIFMNEKVLALKLRQGRGSRGRIMPMIVIYPESGKMATGKLLQKVCQLMEGVPASSIAPDFNLKVMDGIYYIQGNGGDRPGGENEVPDLDMVFDKSYNMAVYNPNPAYIIFKDLQKEHQEMLLPGVSDTAEEAARILNVTLTSERLRNPYLLKISCGG